MSGRRQADGLTSVIPHTCICSLTCLVRTCRWLDWWVWLCFMVFSPGTLMQCCRETMGYLGNGGPGGDVGSVGGCSGCGQ